MPSTILGPRVSGVDRILFTTIPTPTNQTAAAHSPALPPLWPNRRLSLAVAFAIAFVTLFGCSARQSDPPAPPAENSAPSITTQPVSATVNLGQAATFTVAATGTAPLSYQWQKNSANITGATSASYTTPATTAADSGAVFTVTVTNVAGSITSTSATLTVNLPPSITTQPASATVNLGQAATFTVVATGTAPLSYQWQKNSTNISGATSASYTTPATAAGDNGSTFQVVITNALGSITSNSATLTVNLPPSITTQPASETVDAGQTATFIVAATGSAPLTYQWQSDGVNISGANSLTYTTPATTGADDGTQFTVIVSNPAGSVASAVAILTVDTPPTIFAPPSSQTVAIGEMATFSVAVSVTGTLPLSYQWLENNVAIPGATSQSYTTPATTGADSGEQFSVVVSNSLGAATSNAATVTVVQPNSPATYYVDFASGADTNNGLSKDAPWKYAPGMNGCAFNCAVFGLHPGDQVIFKGGVTWDATGFPMVISASGASGNPIYFGVDQTWFAGSAWSRPVFDLYDATWSVAPLLVNFANFVTLDNLEIKNEEVDNSGSWPPRSSITVEGGSNVIIQNCYVHGWSIQNPIAGSDQSPTGGIAFYSGSAGGVVTNCVLDGSPESDSGVGIYGGTSIQGNIIENVPNGIVVTDPVASISGNQVFAVPYSADPSESSYAIFAYTSGSIFNNVVHDLVQGALAIYLESGSIFIYQESDSELGNTQYIYNNLVWNVGDNAPIVIASDELGIGSTSNQFIYNNTLLGGTAAGCVSVNPAEFAPTNLTVQNNHCISELPTSEAWCWNQSGGSFDCGSVSNLTFGNNVLMTTESAASQNYTLANSFQPSAASGATVGAGLNLVSNCVTAGSSLCSDRLGVARPGGSTAWDVGAYQYQTVAGGIAPSITEQPLRQAVLMGQAATFTVIATGTAPLSYQWLKNGQAIPGATSPVYTTPATTAGDDGTIFSVSVSNTAGSTVSSPAILSVNSAAGQLTPSPTGVAFGTVSIGTTSAASVTLTNTSSDYVTISNVSVSGPGFNANGVPTGIILAPGEAATLNVTFAPAATGDATGSVTINSDAAGSPTTISLSGTGVQPPHWVSLTWDPSTSPVFGYYVYRATSEDGPYTRLNVTPVTTTQYTDLTVQPGQAYLYWVTSVDSDTIESPFSNSVSVVIPTP